MYCTYNKISSSPLQFTTDVHHDMQIIRQQLIFGKEENSLLKYQLNHMTLFQDAKDLGKTEIYDTVYR